jgi:hypothetical protein
MIPRQDEPTTLGLTFSTHVRPDDFGPIGLLSMSIPPIEPYVVERDLAQVGSGTQALRVAVRISCLHVEDPLVTQQVIVTLRDPQGQLILSQTFEYVKRWCE